MNVTILISISYLTNKIDTIPPVKIMHFGELMSLGYFDKEFRHQFGNLFEFDDTNHHMWAIRELPLPKDVDMISFVIENIAQLKFELATYFNFLWFKKDNNVSVNNQYGYVRGRPESYVFNTDRPDFCADAKLYHCSFTEAEIVEINKIYSLYLSKNKNHQVTVDMIKNLKEHGESNVGKGAISGMISAVHYDDFTNIERAIMFMGASRSIEFLPQRISVYMQILETLFATEAEGVNFKIPLRVASYIENENPKNRKIIFDYITEAYNIRSRYVHGDRLNRGKRKMQMHDVIPISARIDNIIRVVLKKIITKDMDNFLLPTDDIYDDGKFVKYGLRTYLTNITFQL